MADPATMMLAATAVSAGSQVIGGYGKYRGAKAEAKQMRQQAKAQEAQGIAESQEIGRQTEVNLSDARAAMAAGGGTTTDSGAIQMLGKIGEVGEFNALSALFGGRSKAQNTRQAAAAKKSSAKNAFIGDIIGGGATALGGYGEYKAATATPAPPPKSK